MHKDRKKYPVVCVVLKGRKFTPREHRAGYQVQRAHSSESTEFEAVKLREGTP